MFKSEANWLGKLDLKFSLKNGRSVLTKNSHCGPFFVQKSFYSHDDDITPNIYLLHPPGGLVGGDHLILSVHLDPSSRALITTPSSTKFYRTNGKYALQENVFLLSNYSVLEWIPQSIIFFAKTKAKMSTIFKLSKGARMVSFEMLCLGNINVSPSMYPEEIDVFSNISLPCSVGLRDRLKINALNCLNKLSGFQIVASLFAVPADEILLKQVRELIKKSINNVQIGSATLLDELLVVRLLGNDNQRLKALLNYIWSVIRPKIIGKKVIIPRIWFT